MAGFLEERLREQELSQIRAIKLSSGYMLALVSDVLDMGRYNNQSIIITNVINNINNDRFEAGRVVLESISVDIHDLLTNNFMCAEGLVTGHRYNNNHHHYYYSYYVLNIYY